MTEQLKQVVAEVERLSPEAQDAIAALIRDELRERERRRYEGLKALAQLKAFQEKLRRAGDSHFDAVQIVREGREELDRRSTA